MEETVSKEKVSDKSSTLATREQNPAMDGNDKTFLTEAIAIVEKGRQAAYSAVNQAMIATYWQLGKHIVEFEQGGAERAQYGKDLMDRLSMELTAKFGKGYTARNLRNFRQFYLLFPHRRFGTRVCQS